MQTTRGTKTHHTTWNVHRAKNRWKHNSKRHVGVVVDAEASSYAPTPHTLPIAKQVLGVYVSGSKDALRAAPVDVETGAFLAGGVAAELQGREPEQIAEAIRKVVEAVDWTGIVGVGLPGQLNREVDAMSVHSVQQARKDRNDMEKVIRDAVHRPIVVMTGAEASGHGEIAFGAAQDQGGAKDKLVLVVTLGKGIGAALFDHGLPVLNLSVEHITSTWDAPEASDAPLPPPEEDDPVPWQRWADRVQSYLGKLADTLNPELIIISGASAASFDKYKDLLDLPCDLRPGKLGPMAGVKGAAAGAAQRKHVRDELFAMQRALRMKLRGKVTTEEGLHEAFNALDRDGDGLVSVTEIATVARDLGLLLEKGEAELLLGELDVDNVGALNFQEFSDWWKQAATAESVTVISTEAEFDDALAESAGGVLCLLVGFTFCRPCKALKPKYSKIANAYDTVRFLYVNGNENASTINLCRDRLKVKTSPSAFIFRQGELTHQHSGKSEEKIIAGLNRNLPEGEIPAEYRTVVLQEEQ